MLLARQYGREILQALDAHAIVSVTDVDGTITHANSRFAELTGYSIDELVGANHRVLRSGYHTPAFYEDLWLTISQGRRWHGKICNRRRDGRIYWVETTIVPFLDDHGLPQHYVSIRTDVTALVEARDKLLRSQHFAGVGSWEWDIGAGRVHWSEVTSALFGLTAESRTLDYRQFLEFVHPDDRERLQTAVSERIEEQSATYELEHRIQLPGARVRWLQERGDVEYAADGTPMRMLGLVQDITEQREAEDLLIRSERKWRAVMEQNRDAILLGDVHGNITDANSAAETLFGYHRRELIGRHVGELYPQDHREEVLRRISALTEGDDTMREARIRRPDGSQRDVHVRGSHIRIPDGAFLIGVYRDVTDQKLIRGNRSQAAEGIDRETGLLLREWFLQRLEEAQPAFRPGQLTLFALAVIRLENLAEIQAAYGGDVARAVTVAFAERLREAEVNGASCGRLGDNEFGVAWPQMPGASAFSDALDSVVRRLREPFDSAGQAIHPRVSAGTSAGNRGEAPGIEELLNRARLACTRAAVSPDEHVAFDETLGRNLSERARIEQGLRRALNQQGFHAVYQPQVDLYSRQPSGLEVLARWHDAELGVVSPARFTTLADELGLLNPVSLQIFDRALMDLRGLLTAHPELRVALNISPTQLRSPAFINDLEALVRDSGVPARQIELEITETATVEDEDQLVEVLSRWRDYGFQIAIDDFGTGFSSLNRLRRLPIDRLKIDRSFVGTMDSDLNNAAIVEAVLGLAVPLGFSCVAEGIENPIQYDALRGAGCDVGQGYYIARPMELETLLTWLGASPGDSTPPRPLARQPGLFEGH